MFRFLVGFCLLFCSFILRSDDVVMAFGDAIPPFSFPETNSGIELEVIGAALAHRNHRLVPKYYPLARVPVAFALGEVQAAMTDLGKKMTNPVYHGDPAVVYNNVLITLKERNISINKPEDLTGLSVISFQGALKRYPQWLEPIKTAGKYLEQNNQMLQVLTLNEGHYDVVLSDKNIFQYYALQVKLKKGHDINPVQFHNFVELNPLDYRPVFWDKVLRDDFNEGLAYLKETGRYKAIYDKYLKE